MIKTKIFNRFAALLSAVVLTAGMLSGCSEEDGPENLAPTLYLGAMNQETDLSRTTAILNGEIQSKDLTAISSYGFLYSKSKSDLTAAGAANATRVECMDGGTTKLTCTLSDLDSGAEYFYCLYAESGQSLVLSASGSFTTKKTDKPLVDAVTVIDRAERELTLSSRIIDDGGADIVEQGFRYRKENTATGYTTLTAEQYTDLDTRTFSLTLTGLDAASNYVVQAYARNASESTDSYSEEIIVRTGDKVTPVVDIPDAPIESELGANWMLLRALITDTGLADVPVEERGFVFSASSRMPTVIDTENCTVQKVETESMEFVGNLRDLTPETTYYIRAFAANRQDGVLKYGYSDVLSITTTALVSPSLIVESVTDVTSYSAKVNAKIENAGTGYITERGFCYSQVNVDPTVADNVVLYEGKQLTYSATLTNLDFNTTYYVRAYVKDGDDIVYSGRDQFKTIEPNPLSISDFGWDQGGDYVELSAIISTTEGEGTVTERGFCWIDAGTLDGHNQVTLENCDGKVALNDGEPFAYTVTGLIPGGTYGAVAYIKVQIGTQEFVRYSYDLIISQATLSAPVCDEKRSTELVMSASDNNWDAKGEMAYGFCWSTDPQADPATLTHVVGTYKKHTDGYAEVTATLTGLESNTTYYVYTYITHANGTWYSTATQTTTNQPTPLSIGDFQMRLEKGDYIDLTAAVSTTDGEGIVTERGFCWVSTEKLDGDQLTLANCEDKVTLSEGDSFACTITGLIPGGRYTVCAFIKVQIGTQEFVRYSTRFIANMQTLGTPVLYNCGATELEVHSGSNQWDAKGEMTYGFCWGTDPQADPATLTHVEGIYKKHNDGYAQVSATLTGLESNTTYYIYTYITHANGTWYSDVLETHTQRIPGKDDAVSPK